MVTLLRMNLMSVCRRVLNRDGNQVSPHSGIIGWRCGILRVTLHGHHRLRSMLLPVVHRLLTYERTHSGIVSHYWLNHMS